MRKRVSGVLLSAFCGGVVAATGDFDAAFLQGQPLNLSSVGIDRAMDMTVADDGSFTLTGVCGAVFCVAHFHADGSLNTAFGNAGLQRFETAAISHPMALYEYQEDGTVDADEDGESGDADDADDIISHHFRLLGHDPHDPQKLLLARFNADGTLDHSFDVSEDDEDTSESTDDVDEDANDDGVVDENYDKDGVVELKLAGVNIVAEATAIGDDGRIAIAGSAQLRATDAHRKLLVSRATTDGLLDTSLYGSGKQFLTLAAQGETYTPKVDQVYVDSANRIIVAGHSLDLAHNVGFILRLSANGVLDSDFDGDGIRVWYPDNGSISRVNFAVDLDHRVAIVLDYHDEQFGDASELHLLQADGSDLTTFNGDGGQLLQPNNKALSQHTIAWQYDGGVIMSGMTSTQQLISTRFDSDGVVGHTGADIWQHAVQGNAVKSLITRSGRLMILNEQSLLALSGDKLTPSAFAFAAQTDVPLTTLTASEAVMISGLDRTSLVTIEDGTIAINDEAECDDSLTRYNTLRIKNGDYLCAFVTSSDDYQTTSEAKLRIGSDVVPFTVTTEADTSDSNVLGGGGALSPVLWLVALIGVARRKQELLSSPWLKR